MVIDLQPDGDLLYTASALDRSPPRHPGAVRRRQQPDLRQGSPPPADDGAPPRPPGARALTRDRPRRPRRGLRAAGFGPGCRGDRPGDRNGRADTGRAVSRCAQRTGPRRLGGCDEEGRSVVVDVVIEVLPARLTQTAELSVVIDRCEAIATDRTSSSCVSAATPTRSAWRAFFQRQSTSAKPASVSQRRWSTSVAAATSWPGSCGARALIAPVRSRPYAAPVAGPAGSTISRFTNHPPGESSWHAVEYTAAIVEWDRTLWMACADTTASNRSPMPSAQFGSVRSPRQKLARSPNSARVAAAFSSIGSEKSWPTSVASGSSRSTSKASGPQPVPMSRTRRGAFCPVGSTATTRRRSGARCSAPACFVSTHRST